MSTPICRCRVLYLGSAVPHITKDGLQGIQEPLRELYPDEGIYGTRGIDSWLSVWSNGLLLENVDEHGQRISRFFPVQTLHYCAAIRHVVVPGTDGERVQRFLPLDSPFARLPSAANPPLFACILRRTTGIKVLECHAFICKKEMAANALVRCCFHSYADNMYARQLETTNRPGSTNGMTNMAHFHTAHAGESGDESPVMREISNGNHVHMEEYDGENGDLVSIYDENHKVWGGSASSSSPSPDKQSVALYGEVATTASVKSGESHRTATNSRVRQMVLPSKPPPPGVEIIRTTPVMGTEEKKKTNKKKGDTKQRKSQQNGHHQHQLHHHHQQQQQQPPPPHLNGRLVHPPRPPHLPPGEAWRYRGGGSPVYPQHHPPPPPLIAPNGRPLPPLIMTRSAEEPTYMPSARPLSPTASYQPMAFPYDRYYMQYNGMSTQPRPISANAHKSKAQQQHQQQQQQHQQKKRKGGSASDKNSDGTDSKFSTGIYRKKGHLNERAFSYSIRQEHRSRSHSSLAAIAFNGNGHGDTGTMAKNSSTEKELSQMVNEISLSDDEEDARRRRFEGSMAKTAKANGRAAR